MRRLTLVEWASVISAVGTIASAIFAVFAVMAANDQVKVAQFAAIAQVKVAIDAVNRGEKLKNLSEFVNVARAACKLLVPKEYSDDFVFRPLDSKNSPHPSVETYAFRQRSVDIDEFKRKYNSAEFEQERWKSFDEVISRSKNLEIWIEKPEDREILRKFSYSYWSRSLVFLAASKVNVIEFMERAYSACQTNLDKTIEDITK